MKLIKLLVGLACLFGLLATPADTYAGASLPPSTASTASALTLDRLTAEGDNLLNGLIHGDNSSTAYSVGGSLGGFTPPPGKAYYINAITVSCSADAEIYIGRSIAGLIANGSANVIASARCGPTQGMMVIPLNDTITEGETIAAQTRTAFASQSGGAATWVWAVGISGKRITNDFDYSASKVVLVVGDSIDNTTGVTYGSDFWWWKVKRWLARSGSRARFVVKGDGGWQASHGDLARQYGRLDIPQADMIIVKLGTNDTATSSGTYQGYLNNLIAWKQDRYPQAKMLFLSPPLRQGTAETTMQTRRTDISTVVTAANDPLVKYCDTSGAITNTDDTYYFTADGTTAGNRVHLNALGQTGLATTVEGCMTSLNFKP